MPFPLFIGLQARANIKSVTYLTSIGPQNGEDLHDRLRLAGRDPSRIPTPPFPIDMCRCREHEICARRRAHYLHPALRRPALRKENAGLHRHSGEDRTVQINQSRDPIQVSISQQLSTFDCQPGRRMETAPIPEPCRTSAAAKSHSTECTTGLTLRPWFNARCHVPDPCLTRLVCGPCAAPMTWLRPGRPLAPQELWHSKSPGTPTRRPAPPSAEFTRPGSGVRPHLVIRQCRICC